MDNYLAKFVIWLFCNKCARATKDWHVARLHSKLTGHKIRLVGRFAK